MRRRAELGARAFGAARLALIASAAPLARAFEQALDAPARAQDRVLRHLLAVLPRTTYGRRFGVGPRDGYRRFREKVPIASFEDFAPFVERQMKGEDALTTDVVLYERTSGSSGAVKHIPYTRALRASFGRMFRLWAFDLLTRGPRLCTGRFYFSVSPSFSPPALSPSRVPIGLEDDADYLSGWLRALLSPFLAVPPEVGKLRHPEAFRTELAFALLAASDLELVSVWSPSFFLVILDHIDAHRHDLARRLARGGPAGRARADLVAQNASYRELWPELKVISCWASAAAGPGAERLAELFPGTLVQPKGLLATEAPMTIPWIPAGGAVPLVTEVLVELEDERGEILRVDEVPSSAEGREYGLVVSQSGGLVRYRIGDRVVVTGRHAEVPCLDFVGREGDVSDLVGEKLNERFARTALADLPLPGGAFRVLVPRQGSQPRYVLVVDAAAAAALCGATSGPRTSTSELATKLDGFLQQAHHYRLARLLGQLAAPEILPVPRAEERIRSVFVARGMRLGDIKDKSLIARPEDAAQVVDVLDALAKTPAQTSGG